MWQCCVVLVVWRRYELRLLELIELFPLQTHWLISMPWSSDNMGNKVGRSSPTYIALPSTMFPCRLFSHCAAPYAGPGDKPSLGGGASIVSLQLLFSHFVGPYAGPGEEPGLGGGAWTVCLQVVCLQCSVICRAGRIAWLGSAFSLFTSTMCAQCIATSWAGRFAWPWLRQTYRSLHVSVCTVVLGS